TKLLSGVNVIENAPRSMQAPWAVGAGDEDRPRSRPRSRVAHATTSTDLLNRSIQANQRGAPFPIDLVNPPPFSAVRVRESGEKIAPTRPERLTERIAGLGGGV